MESPASSDSQPSTSRARSASFRMIALIALGLGCETAYRSSLPLAQADHPSAVSLACAGVWIGEASRRDEAMSDRLRQRTGCEALMDALPPEDLALLVADPASIALASDRRHALQERFGYRYLLLGQKGTTPVDEVKRYSVLLPLPILAPSSFVGLIDLPIPYRRHHDAREALLALRLVDLESGRVTSEHFAFVPEAEGDREVLRELVDEALLGMGLGRAAKP